MIGRRLLGAAIRTLGPEKGREWTYLGALCQAGTEDGVDITCFVLRENSLEVFIPDEDSRFLLADAVMETREMMFEEHGTPRFRSCLVLIRGVDETSRKHFSYTEVPGWGDILADVPDKKSLFDRVFDWSPAGGEQS